MMSKRRGRRVSDHELKYASREFIAGRRTFPPVDGMSLVFRQHGEPDQILDNDFVVISFDMAPKGVVEFTVGDILGEWARMSR